MPFNTCIHCESCGSSLTNSKHLASISELIISYSIHTSYTSTTICYCIKIILVHLSGVFICIVTFLSFLIVLLSSSMYKRLKQGSYNSHSIQSQPRGASTQRPNSCAVHPSTYRSADAHERQEMRRIRHIVGGRRAEREGEVELTTHQKTEPKTVKNTKSTILRNDTLPCLRHLYAKRFGIKFWHYISKDQTMKWVSFLYRMISVHFSKTVDQKVFVNFIMPSYAKVTG